MTNGKIAMPHLALRFSHKEMCEWRSTTKVSIRYDDNSAKNFVLDFTKLLSSTIKIAYADDKLPFLDVNNSAVTYYIIDNHKCPLFLFFSFVFIVGKTWWPPK